MATTTPNYGWSVPTSSDLVKNGATAIETLGDSVDDSLWNSGFGQAGKNKIINGDFGINQRNFTSATTNNTFTFDRFFSRIAGDGTATFTPQTFTVGTAPVAGYEGKNFMQIVTAGQTSTGVFTVLRQGIENVRTFAGQTVTVSFWAKAVSGTPKVSVSLTQAFGTGGSAAVTSVYPGGVTLSTSWVRYSATIAVPSISGKTIGTGDFLQSNLCVSAGSTFTDDFPIVGIQNNTFQFWGVQVEYGSKATPFQLAGGGSPQAELAMCQRYYYRFTPTGTTRIGAGYSDSTTFANVNIVFPVPMRTSPTALEQSGTATDYSVANNTVTVCSAAPSFSSGSLQSCNVGLQVAAGLVLGQAVQARLVGPAGYLGWSAEL